MVHLRIVEDIAKSNVSAQDAEAEIAQIKKFIYKAELKIQLVLVKGHQKPEGNFNQKLLKHLIRECNAEAARQRERLDEVNEKHNIKFERCYAVKHNDKAFSR